MQSWLVPTILVPDFHRSRVCNMILRAHKIASRDACGWFRVHLLYIRTDMRIIST
jgi:hypothetical protein